MNEEFAYVRNGRAVPWYELDAWDLRVIILKFSETDCARFAAIEWHRRFGYSFSNIETFTPTELEDYDF